jgi:1-acyl-sn-glycerol-3-phosphate acyltransferase
VAGSGATRLWRRRAATIPATIATALVVLALLPLLVAAALAADAVRRERLALTRLVAFAAVYGLAEIAGLAASVAVWLAAGPWRSADRERWLALNYAIQSAWARALLGAAARIFALRIVVEGGERVLPGPLLVLPRHASLVDVLLPCVEIVARRALRLRWVLKRELLADPCFDVAGHRLPNVFVDRNAAESGPEVDAIATLAADLRARDGVLIYPEGTRATPAKRARALARLREGGHTDRAERLADLAHVLPPRPGGALALLAAAPHADVLIVGHAGLDGLAEVRDLVSGRLVGRTVTVRFWRHAAASVPREQEPALAWLDARWRELDRWVGERLAEAP